MKLKSLTCWLRVTELEEESHLNKKKLPASTDTITSTSFMGTTQNHDEKWFHWRTVSFIYPECKYYFFFFTALSWNLVQLILSKPFPWRSMTWDFPFSYKHYKKDNQTFHQAKLLIQFYIPYMSLSFLHFCDAGGVWNNCLRPLQCIIFTTLTDSHVLHSWNF